MQPSASGACLSQELLGAWVRGRLPPDEFARVEAHVAGCAECLHRVGAAAREDRALADRSLAMLAPPLSPASSGLSSWAEVESVAVRATEPGAFAAALAPGALAPGALAPGALAPGALAPGALAAGGPSPVAPLPSLLSVPPEERVVDGRYELLERVARGGMGEVFRGRDRQTGAEVAIKTIKSGHGAADSELVARFRREAEILRRLNHPNIVQMLAIVEGNEQHSIVMEYVAGGSLRRELVRSPVLGQVEALLFTLEVAEALSQAHRLDVIHRDVKPENVLLALDGTVRLSDFGLARVGERSFTAPGTVLGTVAYLSPEVLWGHEVDARTDLWSLGVMLFEMLSGVRPFVASSPGATLTAILQQPVPGLAEVCPSAPPALVELTERLLQKDREQRIPTAAELAANIESILETLQPDDTA